MSRKQWGNGFRRGVAAALKKAEHAEDPVEKVAGNTLVGQFFHSYKDGNICWQGKVMRKLDDGKYLVQLYEWMMGAPSSRHIVKASDMDGWSFYATDSDMRIAWEKSRGSSDEQIELSERRSDLIHGRMRGVQS